MELGAVVCTPKAPSCLICPVASSCRARALGLQDTLPVKAPKAPPLVVVESCALVSRGDRVLIVRRRPGGLWEGFWEFPTVHVSGADPAGRVALGTADLEEGVPRLTGIRARIGPRLQTLRFGVTKHRVELRAFAAEGLGGELLPGPGMDRVDWATPAELAGLAFGSASRKLFGALGWGGF